MPRVKSVTTWFQFYHNKQSWPGPPNLFLLSCSILFLINPYNHDSLMAPIHAKHTVVTICLGMFIKRIRIYFACIVALARWKNLEEPNHTQCQSSLPTAGLYYRDDCCHLLLFILTNRVHRLASHISRQPHRPCRHRCFFKFITFHFNQNRRK